MGRCWKGLPSQSSYAGGCQEKTSLRLPQSEGRRFGLHPALLHLGGFCCGVSEAAPQLTCTFVTFALAVPLPFVTVQV